MPTGDDRPNWSEGLPERGTDDLGAVSDDTGPVYAFYMATIRVDVDPRSEEVTEVLVDEGTMELPSMIARADGSSLTGLDREHVALILCRAEWPSWDYGPARHRSSDGDAAG